MDDSQHEFYYWILWAPIPLSHTLITPTPMYFLWSPILACLPWSSLPAVEGGEGEGVTAKLYTPLESSKNIDFDLKFIESFALNECQRIQ